MPLLMFPSTKAKLVSIHGSNPSFNTVAASDIIFLTSWNVTSLTAISANQWDCQIVFFSSCITYQVLPPALMDISYLSMIYLANQPQRNTDHPSKQRRQWGNHYLLVLASNMSKMLTWCCCAMNVDSGGCCTVKESSNDKRENSWNENWTVWCTPVVLLSRTWSFNPPLDEVYIRDITCADHIEKLYFSAGYEPICIYCACIVDEVDSDFFPSVL